MESWSLPGPKPGGQQARGRRGGRVPAADDGADGGAARAGLDGGAGGEGDEVGGADGVLGHQVEEEGAHAADRVVVVFDARHLLVVEEERAVGAAAGGRGEGGCVGEGALVVEGEAEGGAGEVVALAVGDEGGGELGGDLRPDRRAGRRLAAEQGGESDGWEVERGEEEGVRRGDGAGRHESGGEAHFETRDGDVPEERDYEKLDWRY